MNAAVSWVIALSYHCDTPRQKQFKSHVNGVDEDGAIYLRDNVPLLMVGDGRVWVVWDVVMKWGRRYGTYACTL